MPSIELRAVTKRFRDHTAVEDVDLTIQAGKYTTILGPSGCGKTTLLRMMAGLIRPDSGDILIDGKSTLLVPPEDRNIGYLFQGYALFPHMNVHANVGYAPTVKGEGKAAVTAKADGLLRIISLLEWAGYLPRQLSGGMQQRVALVRALAAGGSILFLDEPTSSLDPKTGVRVRYELMKMAKSLGLTVVHITHDQAEAMSVSDRVIVMKRGGIAQTGTPEEVYHRPVSPYVAHFLGESNFMKAESAAGKTFKCLGAEFAVAEDVSGARNLVAAMRPEHILFESGPDNNIAGTVKEANFIGPTTRFIVEAKGAEFVVITAKRPDLRPGMVTSIHLPRDRFMLFRDVADLESELKVL